MSQSQAEGPEFHPESREALPTEALLSSPQPHGLQKMTCPRESPPSTDITDQGVGTTEDMTWVTPVFNTCTPQRMGNSPPPLTTTFQPTMILEEQQQAF